VSAHPRRAAPEIELARGLLFSGASAFAVDEPRDDDALCHSQELRMIA
jgi:hypothetical protein